VSRTNKTLIGVYKADSGLLGEVSYFLGHLIGTRECSLCEITHSPINKKREFKEFEKRIDQEFGIKTKLVHMNERNAAEQRASEGREPCVLLQHEDGSISMFLDFVELKAADGSVMSFEKLVRSRLDFFS
jgi:hypothetical protein